MSDETPELLLCQTCGGRGYLNPEAATCPDCKGTGRVTRPTPAERPVPQAREALDDIQSHYVVWKQALEASRDHALRCNDPDDAAYWRHEISVLDRINRVALTARPSDAAVAKPLPGELALIQIAMETLRHIANYTPVSRIQPVMIARDALKKIDALIFESEPVKALALPPDEPARPTPSTVGVEDIACEYSGVFGSPPRVCVNKDQCHRVGQCYYKKSPSQPAQNGRLKRSPTIASEKE